MPEGEGKMTRYRVGCGLNGIYAGILKNEDEWKTKSDVTDEAVSAVAQYLIENEKGVTVTYRGNRFVMKVERLIEYR